MIQYIEKWDCTNTSQNHFKHSCCKIQEKSHLELASKGIRKITQCPLLFAQENFFVLGRERVLLTAAE
jgi:hypothetical protein